MNPIERVIRHPAGPGLLLALVGIIAYGSTLNNGFIIDDVGLVAGNFRMGLPQHIVYEFFPFLNPFLPESNFYYRPLTNVLPMVYYQFFGLNPAGYHAVNLALLILAAVAIFQLVAGLFKDRPLGFLTALLFLLHPFNGNIPNYIVSGVLAWQLIAMCASAVAFMAYVRGERPRRNAAASLGLFLFALLCHDLALAFPIYLGVMTLIFEPGRLRRGIGLLVPFGLIAFAVFAVKMVYSTSIAHSAVALATAVTPWEYGATVARLLGLYLYKWITADNVVIIWAIPTVKTHLVSWNLLLAAIAGAGIWAVFARRASSVIRWACATFLAGAPLVVFASRYEPAHGWLIEPHWLYFPSAALFAMLAYAFLWILRLRPAVFGLLVVTLYLGTLLCRSWQLNALWADQEAYCTYWAKETPGFSTPLTYLVAHKIAQGQRKEAEAILHQLMIEHPDQSIAYFELGSLAYRAKRLAEARAYFDAAARAHSKPSFLLAYFYGLLDRTEGRSDSAEARFREAVRINPMFLEGRLALAELLAQRGEIKAALTLAADNLAVHPYHPETLLFVTDFCDIARQPLPLRNFPASCGY